jgi:SOS response regulatory protein OraA/RecX
MPTFYEETDFDIGVDDFLEECSNFEIEEVIDYLEEMGYLKNYKRSEGGTPVGILEEEFQERIKKLSESRHRLTLEEEEIIKKISDRL